MTRLALAAALAAAGFMTSPQITLAAKGFKGGFKPVPFRAHGLFRPVTPRTLSHSGLPAKFHGHFRLKKNIVQPVITGLTGGGLALLNPTPFHDAAPEEAIVRPALVPVGGTVGCATEDIEVAGSRTVSIIRC